MAFPNNVVDCCPVHPHVLHTDDDKAFTDRLLGKAARQAACQHSFNRLAEAHGINHRLVNSRNPGMMAERFNDRIAEMLHRRPLHRVRHLERAIVRCVRLHNHHTNQKGVGHQQPVGARKERHQKRPDLFSGKSDQSAST